MARKTEKIDVLEINFAVDLWCGSRSWGDLVEEKKVDEGCVRR